MDEGKSPEDEVSAVVVDVAFHMHRELGPGMLESAYESVLCYELSRRGLKISQQVPVPLIWNGMLVKECFRADVVVEDLVLVELKSVPQLAAVHKKQTITYLKLMNLKLGLLINFGAPVFSEVICRLVNGLR